MAMRRYVLFFLLVSASPVFGQLTIHGEYSQAEIDVAGLNGFVDSFNSFWGSKLSAPYESYEKTTFSMPNFGLGFRYSSAGNVGFTANTHVLYGRKIDEHRATWATGVQNEVAIRLKDIRWNFSMGVHIKLRLFAEVFIGSTFRGISLKHYTIYPDGSRSISSEYKLNGLYRGNTSALDLGLQLSYRLGPFLVFGRVSNPMNGFPPGKDIVSLTDANTANFPPNDFPTDFGLYATDPVAFAEQDLGLKTDDFEGKRLTIGLEFWPFTRKFLDK